MKKILLVAFALLLLIGVRAYLWQYDLASQGGDFAINSTTGVFKLKENRGKVVVIYFGYRYCPDVCPTTLAQIATVKRKLPADLQKNMQILFISVDPKRDSLPVLAEYVKFFDEDFVGATASKTAIDKIAKMYGAKYVINPPKGEDPKTYTVDHSTAAFIVNKAGKLVDAIEHNEPQAMVMAKLINYLKETL